MNLCNYSRLYGRPCCAPATHVGAKGPRCDFHRIDEERPLAGRTKIHNCHLPPRMVFKHGAYYRTPRIDGRQIMQRLGSEYGVALATYHELEGVETGVWRSRQMGFWDNEHFEAV